MKKTLIATHNGEFHADDVFAVAMLDIVFEGNIEVVRTRDQEEIQKADIVVDVGRVYNADKNLFDHHQEGGAGVRVNGVPYASSGLVWKKLGNQICLNNIDISANIDSNLIAPMDANDVGYVISNKVREDDPKPYTISAAIASHNPSYGEDLKSDNAFKSAVSFAKIVLTREILREQGSYMAKEVVEKAYAEAEDKRVIELDTFAPWKKVIEAYPEPLYVVYPDDLNGRYVAKAVSADTDFTSRKPFPMSWRGKEGRDLESATGITGSVFCHNAGFILVAQTKEAILELVKKSIES